MYPDPISLLSGSAGADFPFSCEFRALTSREAGPWGSQGQKDLLLPPKDPDSSILPLSSLGGEAVELPLQGNC